jgi:hypothetical protein
MAIGVNTATDTTFPHYVDWGAIILGAFVASATSMVLFAFGTGIGLSTLSPYPGESVSKATYFVLLGLWTIWVIVFSSVVGGYIAGRLRRRIGDATEHESDVRDGAHGLGVWGLGVVVASLFIALGVAGVIGTTSKVVGAGAAAAAAKDPNTATVDALFRIPPNATSANMTDRNGVVRSRDKAADSAEIARLLTTDMVRGELPAEDKSYVASLVAAHTGMTQAQADERVDQVLAEAKHKADQARKAGIIIAFITAASLLVGAAAAAGAATMGGRHRDQNTDTSAIWRWPA